MEKRMADTIAYDKLKDRILEIYVEHGDQSEGPLEQFLNEALENLDTDHRMLVLDRLIDGLEPPVHEAAFPGPAAIDDHVLARVIKLLLGRDISKVDLSSDELLESLAESINTVFESLNQLISVINTTLIGKQDPDQTIRQVIGYNIEGSSQARPLETYIGQIGKAFFEAQEASKKAAHAKVKQILEELDPEKIATEAGGSPIGPFRRAKSYELYEHKYEKFRNWFESGRFMESFLREFEKNCRNISF
jgi:hypothetical protein